MAETRQTIDMGWGFSGTQREPTDLERQLNLQMDEAMANPDLEGQGNRFMLVYFDGKGHAGIYRGITSNGGHVLQPSIINRGVNNWRWENGPTLFYRPIEGFQRATEEALRSAGSNFDDVKHLGKYIPVENLEAEGSGI